MANPLAVLRCFGSPRQLAAAVHKEAVELFSGRSVARALLRPGHDCTAFHQCLDSDVRQGIKIRRSCEDERVRGRCFVSRPAAGSDAQTHLCGRASTDAFSFPWKGDDCHASYCAAHMALIPKLAKLNVLHRDSDQSGADAAGMRLEQNGVMYPMML